MLMSVQVLLALVGRSTIRPPEFNDAPQAIAGVLIGSVRQFSEREAKPGCLTVPGEPAVGGMKDGGPRAVGPTVGADDPAVQRVDDAHAAG